MARNIVEKEEHIDGLKLEEISLRNRIDELKREALLNEEAQKIALHFLKDGYDGDLLRGFRVELNRLGMKDAPKASIKRLLDGLRVVKEISQV